MNAPRKITIRKRGGLRHSWKAMLTHYGNTVRVGYFETWDEAMAQAGKW